MEEGQGKGALSRPFAAAGATRLMCCRPDTFSLGVCNGCQLMALLGWVPGEEKGSHLAGPSQPRFIHNTSGRFESRWTTVQIREDSPAVMLKVSHRHSHTPPGWDRHPSAVPLLSCLVRM